MKRSSLLVTALALVTFTLTAPAYSRTYQKSKQTNDQIVFWQGNYTAGTMTHWAELLSHFDVVVLSNIFDMNNCIISVPLPDKTPGKWPCLYKSGNRVLEDKRKNSNFGPLNSQLAFTNRTPVVNLDIQAIPIFKNGGPTPPTTKEFLAKIRSFNPHVKIFGYVPSTIDEIMANDPLVINGWRKHAALTAWPQKKKFLNNQVLPAAARIDKDCNHPAPFGSTCVNFIWAANKLKELGVDGIFIDYFADTHISTIVRDNQLAYVHQLGLPAMLNVLDNQIHNVDFVNNSSYAQARDIILLEGWYFRSYIGEVQNDSIATLEHALRGKTKVAALATLNGSTVERSNCADWQVRKAYAAYWSAIYNTKKFNKAYFGYQPSHLGTSSGSASSFPSYLLCNAQDYSG